MNKLLKELDGLYEKIFSSYSNAKEAEIALLLFEWLTFAIRPMRLGEIRLAACISMNNAVKSIRNLEGSEHWIDFDEKLMNRLSALSHSGMRKVVKADFGNLNRTALEHATDLKMSNTKRMNALFTEFRTNVLTNAVEKLPITTIVQFDHESVVCFMDNWEVRHDGSPSFLPEDRTRSGRS
jgi:galactose-1-phosphate uridylyltransferase